MEKTLMCPRTEICFIYKTYVDNVNDEKLGIIKVSTIENRDYYNCMALSRVSKFLKEGKLSEATRVRLEGIYDCLLIDQANNLVEKRRQDS